MELIPPEHVETAGYLGIASDRAVNYHCDSEDTRLNYEVVWQAVADVQCSTPLDEHWKDAIEYGVPFRKLFISYLPVLFLRKLCCLEAGQFAQIPLKYAALQRLFKCRISRNPL